MKNNFIFISNSFGGIKSFRNILLEELTKKNINCILIDKTKHEVKKKIKFYKINVLSNIIETIKIIKKLSVINKSKKSIFIFSNPIIFLLYFFFIKFFFKKYKIFFFVHSHITKQKFVLNFSNYIVSVLFLFMTNYFMFQNLQKMVGKKNTISVNLQVPQLNTTRYT